MNELIDRSVYLAISNEAITQGFTLDLSLYPNSPTGSAQMGIDQKNIITSKGFYVEIFGVSSSQQRGDKKYPRIVIDYMGSYPNRIGVPFQDTYQNTSGNFIYTRGGSRFLDFKYTILLESLNVSQMRVMIGIVEKALLRCPFIPLMGFPNEFLNVIYQNNQASSNNIEGALGQSYSIVIPDIDLGAMELNLPQVPLINQIDINTITL